MSGPCYMENVLFFRNNLKRNLYGNFLVEAHSGTVFAHFLHGLRYFYDLAVYLVAELQKSLCNLDGVDRAENRAGSARLGSYCQLDALESLSGSLGISLDFGNLVGTLLLVFGELLQSGFGSDDGFSLRDEVIAAVTVLYLDNIVFIAESGYILFKYQFHNESFLSGG